MDFLKDIFGEKPLTFDEFAAAVAGSGLQIADLSKGDYVKKETNIRVNNELTAAKKKAKEAEEALAELQGKSMTADEKLKAALEAAAAKEKQFTISTNKLKAEKILASAGIAEEQYSKLLDRLVTDDESSTVEAVTALSEMLSKQNETAAAKAKADLIKETPKPAGNGNGGGSTEKDIGALLAEQRAESTKGLAEARDAFFK